MHDVKNDKLIDMLNNKNNVKALKIANMLCNINNGLDESIDREKYFYELKCNMYSYFLSLIDRKTRIRLKIIDFRIKIVTDFFKDNTKWDIGRNYGFYCEYFKNLKDPTFNTCTIHKIHRDVSTDSYEALSVKDLNAIRFVREYRSKLKYLSDLYALKENIMSGNYIVNDLENQELCYTICDYLGFAINENNKKLILE